jgi:hypothetical protein
MAIPESQLEIWSHIGAGKGSSHTYNHIKDALESGDTPYAGKNTSVFLQGSYGNNTNIYAESDVDVVICLNDCFQSDRSNLRPEEEAAWKSTYHDATYTHGDFKKDVMSVLEDNYGGDVKTGTKAIVIEGGSNRRKADVITAVKYRRYYKFNGLNDQSYDEGICFYTSDGKKISNYPKQHRSNLTKKHQNSGDWLKPMIRIMKNMRSRLLVDKLINAGAGPSYFIEGLLYNVPSEQFHTDYQTCFLNAFNWIVTEAEQSKLVCANEQHLLIFEDTPTSWAESNFKSYMNGLHELWTQW